MLPATITEISLYPTNNGRSHMIQDQSRVINVKNRQDTQNLDTQKQIQNRQSLTLQIYYQRYDNICHKLPSSLATSCQRTKLVKIVSQSPKVRKSKSKSQQPGTIYLPKKKIDQDYPKCSIIGKIYPTPKDYKSQEGPQFLMIFVDRVFGSGQMVKAVFMLQFHSIGCSSNMYINFEMQPQLYWLMPLPLTPPNIVTHPSLYFLPPNTPPLYPLYPPPLQTSPVPQYQPPTLHQNLPLPPNSVRQRRHFKRRSETQLIKCHKCPYPKCYKDYASDLALNLHMKNKHRGGNKKERDHAAKLILRSELAGRPAPKCEVELPPGYLESNKIRLLLETESQVEEVVKVE